MKLRLRFTTLPAGLLALLAMPVGLPAQEQPVTQQNEPHDVRYIVTDLGVLGTGNNSSAFGLNNRGWVGGSSNLIPGGPQRSFLWFGEGPLLGLGTLGGPDCSNCNSEAGGPNLFGEAPILSETSNPAPNNEDFCGFGTHLQCLAAIWRAGALTALPTLPGGDNSQALWVNNRGQVAGFSENGVPDASCGAATPFQATQFEAVIWEPNGEPRELEPLPGDTVGFAFDINDHGQAVGTSGPCSIVGVPPSVNGLHAVLWEKDGTPIDLGNLGGTAPNVAGGINNRGEVVGASQFTDGTIHPFFWTKNTGIQDLGAFPGAFATVVPCCNSINDRGEVVGFAIDPNGIHAVVWLRKKIKDLNTLVFPNSPLYLQAALSINKEGEIVGQGCVLPDCLVLHAFFATPCTWDGCDDVEANATTDKPKVIVSEYGRKLLRKRAPYGTFSVGPAEPK